MWLIVRCNEKVEVVPESWIDQTNVFAPTLWFPKTTASTTTAALVNSIAKPNKKDFKKVNKKLKIYPTRFGKFNILKYGVYLMALEGYVKDGFLLTRREKIRNGRFYCNLIFERSLYSYTPEILEC